MPRVIVSPGAERQRLAQERGRRTQRRAFHQRVASVLKAELTPLAGRVPLAELAPIAAAIWHRAYSLGYQTGHLTARRRRR